MIASYYCRLCKHWHRHGQILEDHKRHAVMSMRIGKLKDYDVEELDLDTPPLQTREGCREGAKNPSDHK